MHVMRWPTELCEVDKLWKQPVLKHVRMAAKGGGGRGTAESGDAHVPPPAPAVPGSGHALGVGSSAGAARSVRRAKGRAEWAQLAPHPGPPPHPVWSQQPPAPTPHRAGARSGRAPGGDAQAVRSATSGGASAASRALHAPCATAAGGAPRGATPQGALPPAFWMPCDAVDARESDAAAEAAAMAWITAAEEGGDDACASVHACVVAVDAAATAGAAAAAAAGSKACVRGSQTDDGAGRAVVEARLCADSPCGETPAVTAGSQARATPRGSFDTVRTPDATCLVAKLQALQAFVAAEAGAARSAPSTLPSLGRGDGVAPYVLDGLSSVGRHFVGRPPVEDAERSSAEETHAAAALAAAAVEGEGASGSCSADEDVAGVSCKRGSLTAAHTAADGTTNFGGLSPLGRAGCPEAGVVVQAPGLLGLTLRKSPSLIALLAERSVST